MPLIAIWLIGGNIAIKDLCQFAVHFLTDPGIHVSMEPNAPYLAFFGREAGRCTRLVIFPMGGTR